MTEKCVSTPRRPAAIYVWLVPSEEVLDQPGSWRIRMWDTEPFPEANYAASETKAHSSSPEWQAAMATSKLFGEGASDKRWSTPRADAAAYWPEGKDIGNECVDAETARRLERELAEVKKYAAFVDAEIDALRGGRPTSATRATCGWYLDGEDSNCYATGCGHYYTYAEEPSPENEVHHCQGCGGKIVRTDSEAKNG